MVNPNPDKAHGCAKQLRLWNLEPPPARIHAHRDDKRTDRPLRSTQTQPLPQFNSERAALDYPATLHPPHTELGTTAAPPKTTQDTMRPEMNGRPPVPRIYRFFGTGLGAAMWFWVCLTPHVMEGEEL